MARAKEWPRMNVQEALELARVPAGTILSVDSPDTPDVQRFISIRPAWSPGEELPWGSLTAREDAAPARRVGPGAFGGCVYALASLAAARVVEEEDATAVGGMGQRSIHSIQGVFTNPGKIDRPFILDVSSISSSRSFSTRLVNARQPFQPSVRPYGPFPISDASLPAADICFSCLTTFKRPVPSFDDLQVTGSPQERYASILSQRAPDEWEPSPQADIDLITATFPDQGHGAFPMLDMYKVDMKAFNADKEVPERRQLILYRLMKPHFKHDVNAHIVCHAFEADRNGLIMLGNELGYGFNMGAVASLSYSFYIHVNAEETVMEGDGWWVQEVYWPRVSAGRGMLETRTWSPKGKHVATGYQDGIILPARDTKI